MFFTRLGTIVAWLALILGALRFGIGFYVGSIDESQARAIAQARYLFSTSPGTAINQGSVLIAVAIAMGILVEISRAVRR